MLRAAAAKSGSANRKHLNEPAGDADLRADRNHRDQPGANGHPGRHRPRANAGADSDPAAYRRTLAAPSSGADLPAASHIHAAAMAYAKAPYTHEPPPPPRPQPTPGPPPATQPPPDRVRTRNTANRYRVQDPRNGIFYLMTQAEFRFFINSGRVSPGAFPAPNRPTPPP